MNGESECDCVKKIGILTFHKSINYGSVLQAFALSDLLSKRGYAVEIIDYEPASYSIQYRIFEKNTSVHNVAANIRRLSVFDILWEQKKGFEKFREEYLPLSACKFTQASSPQEFSKYYDAVICGSDQIWNVTAKDCDPIFFLPGKQSYKKIAYAASVNTATYNEDVCDDQLRKNILDFDYGAEADGVVVDVNSLVSMNMWGLTPDFLDVLEDGFKEFFEKEVPSNPQKAEYLIPIFIGELLEQGKMSVKVLKTNDTWYGMTYHEDVAAVKDSFKKMLENGVYKAGLFSDL